jgi:RimJ/RimL family protein N-acetyltransferase
MRGSADAMLRHTPWIICHTKLDRPVGRIQLFQPRRISTGYALSDLSYFIIGYWLYPS